MDNAIDPLAHEHHDHSVPASAVGNDVWQANSSNIAHCAHDHSFLCLPNQQQSVAVDYQLGGAKKSPEKCTSASALPELRRVTKSSEGDR